jgi:HTH-type transcriptional regulator/antitoxin HigA
MATLKYKVIKSKAQYNDYTHQLESLVFDGTKGKETREEIDLLTVLIEKWDAEHAVSKDINPIGLLHSLMADHTMKAKDIASLLKVSKGYVSDILHYKKGLSKDSIRILSNYFKVNQEAFNRYYPLIETATSTKPSSIKTSRIQVKPMKRRPVTA